MKMNRPNIIKPNDRAEWLELRKGGIGASEVSAVVGISPWDTPFSLWLRKSGQIPPQEETIAMKLAVDIDPDDVPDHYIAQCQYQMHVTGIHVCYLCWLVNGRYFGYVRLEYDKAFAEWMVGEVDKFWNESRMAKASALGLSPEEVCTLASIIDEETSNNAEKPMIARMYLNRLAKGMPLQADPTVKFALKDFALKRIYHNMLNTDSPYNTYRYAGLPPGPIKVASVAGIEAVLNPASHSYLYMCAKEDFSGTHNFAATYQEHLKNASKYSKALNERGIK